MSGHLAPASDFHRRLLEASPSIYIVLDPAGRVHFATERVARALGCSPDELLQRSVLEFVHPDDREGFLSLLAMCAAAPGRVMAHEYRCVLPGQRTVWLRARAQGQDLPGAAGLVFLDCHDITDFKQAQEALSASEARYRTLIEHMSEGILQVDNDDVIQFANDRFCQMVGYSREELLGQPGIRLMAATEDDIATVLAKNRLRLDHVSDRYEVQIRKRSGETIWLSTCGAPIFDTQGRVVGSLGISTDITQEKRSRDAQARLAAVLEATTDCVLTTDPLGRVLYVNQAGRRMLGLPDAEDASLLDLAGLFPSFLQKTAIKDVQAACLRHGVWKGDAILLSRDGRQIPVSLVTLAGRSSAGEVEVLSHIARDIEERKRFEEQLAHLASHDPLTGLFNRRRLLEELEAYVAHTRRYGTHWALMFLDIDHFKSLNDRLGHHGGDDLLVSVAGTLRKQLRETDTLARLGGDEFACLLPNTGARQAGRVAERVRRALRSQAPPQRGKPAHITASIGIALCPEHGDTAPELLAHADQAMYFVKEHGRDGVAFYTSNMESVIRREQRIQAALEQQQFTLLYQPITSLRGTAPGEWYQLLLRLQVDADEAAVLPAEFLPVAGKVGLTHTADRWLVRTAIARIADQHRRGRALVLEVNLSPRAFEDTDLLGILEAELARLQVSPRSLVLEVTEAALITAIGGTRAFLSELRRLGCRFALDDFGAGFSSFAHLRRLPADYLKIDGSFVRNLVDSPTDQQLVRAMADIARVLGAETIAKDVEDEATLALLRDLGVDHAQGFHLGLPRPTLS